MKFTKMHNAGNDYVYVNGFEEKIEDFAGTARAISHRHYGVGSDGLVVVMPSKTCDIRMRMFNSDGSEAEMCGNASASIGIFATKSGIVKKNKFTMETLAGTKIIEVFDDGRVRVCMGEPVLEAEQIPVIAPAGTPVIDLPLDIAGTTWKATCVSMGNPHAVIFTQGIDDFDLPKMGPLFEHYSAFPRRVNTEFVEVLSPNHLRLRVWERGAGETMACGTGACATTVAAVLKGLCERQVAIDLLGGKLEIEWREADNKLYLTGRPEIAFTGEWKK